MMVGMRKIGPVCLGVRRRDGEDSTSWEYQIQGSHVSFQKTALRVTGWDCQVGDISFKHCYGVWDKFEKILDISKASYI